MKRLTDDERAVLEAMQAEIRAAMAKARDRLAELDRHRGPQSAG
jgi:hypothetical protein